MNPLFRNFYNAIKDAVRAEIEAVKAAKILAQAGRLAAQARRAERRSQSSPRSSSAWDRVMRSLGPLGSVVGAMLRPQAQSLAGDVSRELKAAAELMARMGYDLSQQEREIARSTPTPGSGPARSREAPPITPLSLPGERQRIEQPPVTPTPGGGTGDRPAPASEDREWIVKVVNGRRYRIRRNSPLITGEMIRVKSSNVHSIGYIWNDDDPAHGTLKVRFLDHRKGRNGKAGAGYQYFRVHPEIFRLFLKASSKGKFVWDRLRIRGTVSGHQYRYSISELASDGYTPRKARNINGQEWFLKRKVTGKDGRVYISQLPKQLVGRYRPQGGGPNRGTPNRGR